MIRRTVTLGVFLPLAALLAACQDDKPAQGASAEGEILPGSASDAMLPLDTVRSQPPLAPKPTVSGKPGEASEAATEGAEGEATEAAAPAPAESPAPTPAAE